MEQILYSSRDVDVIVDDILADWDEEIDGEKPEDEYDSSLWSRAYDIVTDYFREIDHQFVSEAPKFGKMLLFGRLGLWNCQPLAYGVYRADNCLSGGEYDDIDIIYRDGDIHINGYHHDGTNCLTIREFKDEYEIEDVEDVEFMNDLKRGDIYIDKNDIERIYRITVSVARYLRPYLSGDAEAELDTIDSSQKKELQYNG